MKKFFFLSFFGILWITYAFGQSKVQNYVFAEKDTSVLTMDVYFPEKQIEERACIIFVFGGGFTSGSKSNPVNVAYCTAMAERGFVVSAIDYRLGLKDMKKMGLSSLKLLRNAIDIAVEDLYSATGFILRHAGEWNIDPGYIIISGSSAGAITVLHADYELANRTAMASVLPADFNYAGVLSFAGAIFSYHGKPKYKQHPAPTFFFHGTEDRIVAYNKIKFFNIGFFGSNALVKRFEKFDYPYCAFRYRDMGHEIAYIPMSINLEEISKFIEEYVFKKRPLKIDATVKDKDLEPTAWGRKKPKDIYK